MARFCIAGIFGNRSDPDAALKTMIGLVAKGTGHALHTSLEREERRRTSLPATRLQAAILHLTFFKIVIAVP